MDNIEDVIKQVIHRIAEKKTDQYSKLERLWMNFLTTEEQNHAKLVGENNGIVMVVVDSSIWLYHMKSKSYKLLKQIKEELGDIEKIQFKIGKIS